MLTGVEGTLATYGFMLAYGLVALAAPVYLAKLNEGRARTWMLGVGGAVAMLFVFYVNWIPTAIPNDIFPALSGTYAKLPYVFLVWTAVGLAWYFAIKFTKPAVVRSAATWGDAADPAAEAEEAAHRVLSLSTQLAGERPPTRNPSPPCESPAPRGGPTPALRMEVKAGWSRP